jgi:hypothetical protein
MPCGRRSWLARQMGRYSALTWEVQDTAHRKWLLLPQLLRPQQQLMTW